MTPLLPSPFLQSAAADESAVALTCVPAQPKGAAADLSHVTFEEACEQLQAFADLPESFDLDLESAISRFSIELDGIVDQINQGRAAA